jgi:hypothetical protein
MGWGKKKDDAAAPLLGKLNPMPWEWEPLTEIQPHRDNAAPQSELSDQGTLKGAGEHDTK